MEEKLEDMLGSAEEHHKKAELLEEAWRKMYSANCNIVEQNLKLLTCSSCDQSIFGITDYSFRYCMRRIKALTRTQGAQHITPRTLKEAEADFIFFENQFLEYHDKTMCNGLVGVKELVAEWRAQFKVEKDEEEQARLISQPTLASKNEPPSKNASTTLNATNPSSASKTAGQPDAVITPAIASNDPPSINGYTQYRLRKEMLPEEQPSKKKDRDSVKDAWIGMYTEAEKAWSKNMTCPDCKEAPGTLGGRHKWSEKNNRKYRNIFAAFKDVNDPRALQKSDFDGHIARLYELEDSYLKENKNIMECSGMNGLDKRFADYREIFRYS